MKWRGRPGGTTRAALNYQGPTSEAKARINAAPDKRVIVGVVAR